MKKETKIFLFRLTILLFISLFACSLTSCKEVKIDNSPVLNFNRNTEPNLQEAYQEYLSSLNNLNDVALKYRLEVERGNIYEHQEFISNLETRLDNNAIDLREGVYTQIKILKDIPDNEIPEEPLDTIVKAFPNAEGAGSMTVGGMVEGTTILHVTTLEDQVDSSKPDYVGTLRWALRKKYPRIIVFDVSGTIYLDKSISMGGYSNRNDWSNCTVLGQTAPKGGITIAGNGRINFEYQDEVVFRYIRFRNGNYGSSTKGLRLIRGKNFIVDHCEFYYGTDEGLATGGQFETFGNLTVQNCLFADNATAMITGNSWAGEQNWQYELEGNVSILKNAFINNSHRFPKAGGVAHFDVMNNVVHNWKWRLMRFDPCDFTLNEINNYYQSGINTTDNNLNKMWSRSWMNPKIYTNGNYVSEDKKPNGYDNDNSLGWYNFNESENSSSFYPLQDSWFVNQRLDFNINTKEPIPTNEIKEYVLNNVGTRHYLNADGSVGTYVDSMSKMYLDYLENDSDIPMLDDDDYGAQTDNPLSNVRPSNFYISSENIPDIWFKANVPNGKSDLDIDSNGYTYFENYINQVDK